MISTEDVQRLRHNFTQRLQSLEAEERQLSEALERVRVARIAQEGAIRGLEILLEQLNETKGTDDETN